jgi:ribosomal-protein-serine acetyltransferase
MAISRSIRLNSNDARLLLRPYELSDAENVFAAVIASRADLSPWMDWCTPQYSIEDTRHWLESLPAAWERREIFGFGVFDAGTEQFVGGCGLNHIQWDYKLGNLGYWVRSERTKEGIATQAALTVARFGLESLGLRRVEIIAATINGASRRVAEKTGARFEGVLRKRIKIGDRNLDAAMYSLVDDDFGRS